MGSYRKAVMTGFICRLCSEQKSVVIHIYSQRAESMDILEKIKLLPITVKKYDMLPKTICEACIDSLCRQFRLVQQIRKSAEVQRRHRMFHSNGRCPTECPLNGVIMDSIDLPRTSDSDASNVQATATECPLNSVMTMSPIDLLVTSDGDASNVPATDTANVATIEIEFTAEITDPNV